MAEKKSQNSVYDLNILIPVILLISLGLVLVYSSSSHIAEHRLNDSYFYLKRQGMFCILGIGIMLTARFIPCTLYAKLVYPMLLVGFCLLISLFIPGVGHRVGGACRWLTLGGFSFQPSEFVKLSLAFYLAYSMAKKGTDMETFSKGLLPHMIIAGIFMLLIVLQPDLGSAIIIGCWLLVVLFVGGVKFRHLFLIFLISTPVVIGLIWNTPYRLKRWLAFIKPWDDPNGIGYQIIHSLLAFGSGGIFGSGLGNSKQKLLYLPESHTDFILSIAAEELGLAGVCAMIIVFGYLIMRGIKVALNARDLYSSYLALGITCLFGLQVIVNMGVVMGLLPTKGLTLPLISYGGTSLVLNLFGMGVLLNISSRT